MIPTRYQNLEQARARFGDRVDRLAPFLLRGDPLADAVIEEMEGAPAGRGFSLLDKALRAPDTRGLDLPPAMRAYLEWASHVPAWVDWDAVRRGGELLLRSGALGGAVLGTYSLVLGYASPGGNKPLVFSGQLVERAPRRLGETSRFVQATAQPGGLFRMGEGFAITLKVRLMHAKVRQMLSQSPKWDTASWGMPVNQHDMAGTSLLFSLVFLEGIRAFGLDVDRDEAECFMHLWRYSGHLIGVDPELLPGSEFDAWNLANLIRATEGRPDDDSRALTQALFDSPLRRASSPEEKRLGTFRRNIGMGFSRGLLGDELADELGIERTPFVAAFHAIRAVTRVAEQARRRSPAAHQKAIGSGARYWEMVVQEGLGGAPAHFAPPERLTRAA
ncbi:oxygenase MpaB family protein [Polyangium sp. 6x1]|uniref:oxygenase MpaB family protein n=1 Tax=Polyangium sp. 6x1 TaxID=3042689 RepID=UPI0024826BBD|nr:oxygenase MpaB family protein [Polyangium sp. 6x1]MDI1450891.1 oxygenase MpaB family protein [Polyangium sp. 6x1]